MGGRGSGRYPEGTAEATRAAILELRRDGAYAAARAARVSARQAAYRAERKIALGIPDKHVAIRKPCSICREELPLYEFTKDRDKPDGRASTCLECKRVYNQIYRDTPAGRRSRRASRQTQQRRKAGAIATFKRERGCLRCGLREPVALDLHHLDPATKSAEINVLVAADRSVAGLREELARCVVVCANCHRMLHAGIWALEDDLGPQERDAAARSYYARLRREARG